MGMPAAQSHRWTADDVRRLRDESTHWPHYECIDGELLVSPGPAVAHQRAVREMLRCLMPYLERERFGELFVGESDLEIRPDTTVQPDVFVIPLGAKPIGAWSDIECTLLVIEVLSPSTAHYDRGIKRRHYQQAGVDEYWIVDLDSRLVERWRPEDKRPEILTERLEWQPAGAGAPLTIDLPALFADVGAE